MVIIPYRFNEDGEDPPVPGECVPRWTGSVCMFREGITLTLPPGEDPAVPGQSHSKLCATRHLLEAHVTQGLHFDWEGFGSGVSQSQLPVVSVSKRPDGVTIGRQAHRVVQPTRHLQHRVYK